MAQCEGSSDERWVEYKAKDSNITNMAPNTVVEYGKDATNLLRGMVASMKEALAAFAFSIAFGIVGYKVKTRDWEPKPRRRSHSDSELTTGLNTVKDRRR